MIEVGVCPYCGGTDLDYDVSEVDLDVGTLYYPFECLDCHRKGFEVYSVEFDHFFNESWEVIK